MKFENLPLRQFNLDKFCLAHQWALKGMLTMFDVST